MTQPPEALSAATPSRFPVRIWLISLAGWMFDFYDLVLFSFLLVPIGKDLALSGTEEATLLGIALGGSGIGGILFGYLSDLRGRRYVMTWTILVYSIGTALTAFATGFWTVLLFRLITGLGVGGQWAVGHALLAESSPPAMRGRASALLQAGEPIGVGLAAIVGFLVAPLIGWRAVFLASSATALVAFLVRRHLPESQLWVAQKDDRLSPIEALRLIVRRRLVGTTLKGFVLGVLKLGTYWTCYTWLPKFLQTEFHQPIARSATWMLTAQLGQLLGMLAFGYLADRFGRRLLFTLYSLLTAAALYPLAFHWQQLLPHPFLFWGAFLALGLGSGCTAGFGALLAELFPTDIRNFAMGTTYNTARGVQFFAPFLVSFFVATHGLAGGLGVPLFLALGTATWVWTLPETRHRDLAAITTEG
ncbi:MAG TPA: MFS transporter [Vicinamibacterales bacterium]